MWKLGARFIVCFCFLATAGSAFAEGFALYEYSARGIALGGAVMARKPDASAMAYNPALMTKLPGTRVMVGASTVSPRGNMSWRDDDLASVTKLKPSTWVIPHVYFTQQINDDWFVGVGEFSRFGLGFEYPHNWPGRFSIYEVSLLSSSLNTNVAWKATDSLSLSAGLEILYVDLDLKKRSKLSVPGVPGGSFEVDTNIQNAHDTGVGFNLAGHYQFNDEWAAGLMYRSQVRVHAKGEAQFTYMGSDGVPAMAEGRVKDGYDKTFEDGKAHSTVILPDSVAGGVSWTPIPDLSVEVGAIWTRWSSFRDLNIHLPGDLPPANSRKHWRDTWRFNVGVEYDLTDWMAIRGGYVYDQSPMTDKYEDYLVPTDGRHIYSTGLGFKYNDWTLDLAYAFIDAKGRSYSQNDETKVLDSKTSVSTTNVFSMSFGYQF